MTKVAELHERWSRDADYCEVYKRLGPEFEVAHAGRGAYKRGVHLGGVGGSDGSDAIGGGADGKRTGAAVDAYAGEGGASDRDSSANQL